MCPSYPAANCGCLTVKPEFHSDVFNRVFSYKDNEGHTVWVNMHGDPNFFLPDNPKEIPSLKMLARQTVRQQLIHMLNKQRRSSYHYMDFQAIQKDLYKTYGLLYELSVWVLPSLNFPTALVRDENSPTPYLKFGEIPWYDLEKHRYHSRLLQADLFKNEFEIWSFIFELHTSRRHPYRLPDLSFKTDEQRGEENQENLFHGDPIKSHGTRARFVYNALNIRWQYGEF